MIFLAHRCYFIFTKQRSKHGRVFKPYHRRRE